jgi:hypothetical protein
MTTGAFYFGSRTANKHPPHEDFGKHYQTSNLIIQASITEYLLEVLKEFDSADEAWSSEQDLIESNWGDPLLMNKHFQRRRSVFSMKGFKRPDVAILNQSKRKPKEERKYICLYCAVEFIALEFIHHPLRARSFCSRRCAACCNKNGTKTCTKGRPNILLQGKPSWNKGLPNPIAAQNGQNGAEKQRLTTTGRKLYMLNGKATWSYFDQSMESWYVKEKGIRHYIESPSAH